MAIDTSVHKSQMTICISGNGGICEQLLFVNNEVIGKCRLMPVLPEECEEGRVLGGSSTMRGSPMGSGPGVDMSRFIPSKKRLKVEYKHILP